MDYEFNNWEAFHKALHFITTRHSKNFPIYSIEVPLSVRGHGWNDLSFIVQELRQYEPEDLKEMSIYGKICFKVTKDENLNNPPTPSEDR